MSDVIWQKLREHSAYAFQGKIRVAGYHTGPHYSEVWSVEILETWFGDR